MTTKPTAGQTVELEGVNGTFTIESINRSRTRMTLINGRGGEGTAALHNSGQWITESDAIFFQRCVIFR